MGRDKKKIKEKVIKKKENLSKKELLKEVKDLNKTSLLLNNKRSISKKKKEFQDEEENEEHNFPIGSKFEVVCKEKNPMNKIPFTNAIVIVKVISKKENTFELELYGYKVHRFYSLFELKERCFPLGTYSKGQTAGITNARMPAKPGKHAEELEQWERNRETTLLSLSKIYTVDTIKEKSGISEIDFCTISKDQSYW